jgi:hypothetical protein
MRKKERKVGDRIFYTNYKGEIETCLIKEIRKESSRQNMFGMPLKDGKLFQYDVYKTGKYSSIEDYNCLSENDQQVKDFCKGKKFITSKFADELRKWLESKGAHKGDQDIAQILYDVAEEYE